MENIQDLSQLRNTGYLAVVCAMLGNLMIGSYYCFSNMNPYVAAYLRSFDASITSKDTLIILPIWLINQSIFSIVGVRLSEKLGYVKVNMIAFVGYTIVNGLMIFVKSYWSFVIVYGFLTGITVGLGYLPSMYIALTYFPNKKPMVTGIILFTAGISASILSPITTYIVNPDNKDDYSTNPDVYLNVPSMYKFLCLYFGLLTLVACGFQPQPYVSQDYKEKKQFDKEEEEYRRMSRMSGRVPSAKLSKQPSLKMDKQVSDMYQEGPNSNNSSFAQPRSRRMSISNQIHLDMDPKAKRVYHNDELRNDMKGVIDSQSVLFMAVADPDKVVDIVQNKQTITKQLQDQRKSIRMSRRLSKAKEDLEIEEFAQKLIEKNRRSMYRKSIMLIDQECPSVRYGLKSSVYIRLALMAFGCSIVNYFLNSVWKDFYRTKFEVSDDKMALLLSMGGFANSFARLLAGALLQKVSFKSIYICLTCSVIFTCFTINFFVNSYIVGAVYLLIVFAGIGTQVTIFPTVTMKVFGAVTGPKIYPLVYMCFSVANMVQYFVLKLSDNWSVMFYMFGGCAILAMVVGFSFNENPNWRQDVQASHLEVEGKSRELELRMIKAPDGEQFEEIGVEIDKLRDEQLGQIPDQFDQEKPTNKQES